MDTLPLILLLLYAAGVSAMFLALFFDFDDPLPLWLTIITAVLWPLVVYVALMVVSYTRFVEARRG